VDAGAFLSIIPVGAILLLGTRLRRSLIFLDVCVRVVVRHFICSARIDAGSLRYMFLNDIRVLIRSVLDFFIMIVPIEQCLNRVAPQ
jgi:hypothetical protein